MRNLKRALSLALATVMTMGLMMVGTGASYQDVDDSHNVEAIEVLQAVGIMTGDENGDFNPDANVTRNEMAVIMSNLLNLDYDYYRGTNPFTDVPSWAAPYVAACAAEGVTAGAGGNFYNGAGNVTAAEAALMVMKTLGYFQYQNDFGDDWKVATIRQASYISLFSGINANAETALTRNQIAQLVLNGLKANMVTFTGDVGTTATVGDTTLNIGYRAEYTARTNADKKYNSIDVGTTNIAQNDQYYVQLGEELYNGDLTLKASTDDFARPANTWRYDGKDIGTYAKAPDLTYTKNVKAGDIYKDLGLSKTINVGDVAVYVDGVENATEGKAYAIRKGDDSNGFGANGVLTEVYYNDDDNSVIITEINTYVGTVVKTVDATSKRDAYVVINPESAINKSYTPSGNMEFETDKSFDDDAYVLYTYSLDTNEIKSVENAEELTGVVTRAENSKGNVLDAKALTIDGTRYVDSYKVAGEELGDISVDEEYTVYLDSYGYLIYVERIDEIGDYALMVQANAGGLFTAKKAALVFADGTTAVVDTAKNYAASGDNHIADGTIVTYRKDADGVYTLRAVTNGTGTVRVKDDNDFAMVNDKAGITNVGGEANDPITEKPVAETTVTANSASTFVVRDPSDTAIKDSLGDWTAYTGIKNAPSITAKGGTDEQVDVYYYCKSGSMVTIMFVVPDKEVVINDGVNKAIFLAAESRSNLIHDKDGDYYEYAAVVNGEVTTVKVDQDTSVEIGGVTYTAKNLGNMIYKTYSVDKYGIITKLNPYDAANAKEGLYTGTGIDKVSKEYTVLVNKIGEDKFSYTITVDEDADFYYVDEDGKISTSSYNAIAIDDNDEVYAIVKDYMVQTLIIVEKDDGTASYNAAIKVDGTTAAADNSKVTVSGNLTKIVRGDDLIFTVEAKNGITVKTVKVDGKTVTADKNGDYVVSNITKTPTIEITTSGAAIVDAKVSLVIDGTALVVIDGKNYAGNDTLKLVSGESYVAEIDFANSTGAKVEYNGTELTVIGSNKYAFVASDGAVLSVVNGGDTATTVVANNSTELDNAITAGTGTIYLPAGTYTVTKNITNDVEIIAKGDVTLNSKGQDGLYVAANVDLKISGVKFVGNGTADGKRGIHIQSGFNGTLEISGCEFVNLATGIYINDAKSATISGNIFNGCNVGISFDNSHGYAVKDGVVISGNTFTNVGLEKVGAQKEAYGCIKSDVAVNYYNGGSAWTPTEA